MHVYLTNIHTTASIHTTELAGSRQQFISPVQVIYVCVVHVMSIHINIRNYLKVQKYVKICTCIYIYIFIYIYIHIHRYSYIYSYLYIYTYTCMYIHIHTYIHIKIHEYIYFFIHCTNCKYWFSNSVGQFSLECI